MIDPLLPIKDVPDELLRALNARFRQVADSNAGQGKQGAAGRPGPPGPGASDLIIAPQGK